jgi:hypothetical protein
MTTKRRTMRELHDERSNQQRAEMQVEIAEGRLKVRQMTRSERSASDARRASHAKDRAERSARRAA